MEESTELGMSVFFNENNGYCYRYTRMISRCLEKKQNMAPMWKKLMKNVDLEGPTSFLDHENLGYIQRDCKPNEIVIEEFSLLFESRIFAGATEKITEGRATHYISGVVLRHGRTCSKMRLSEIVSWQTKKWSNYTKFQVFAWITINSNRKNQNQWDTYHKFAHKVF